MLEILIFIPDGTIDTKKGRNEAFDNIASTFIENWNTTTDEDESANVTDAATGMENMGTNFASFGSKPGVF